MALIEIMTVVAVLKSGAVLQTAIHVDGPEAHYQCENSRPLVENMVRRDHPDLKSIRSICMEFSQ